MTEEIDKHVLKKYEIQQKLGKGVSFVSCPDCNIPHSNTEPSIVCPLLQAYGIVWRAVDKKTRETVALKKIFDAFQNATDAQVRIEPRLLLLSIWEISDSCEGRRAK